MAFGFRTLLRQPDQLNLQGRRQPLTLWGNVTRSFVKQQPNCAPGVRVAQQAEKVLKILLPHIRAAQDNSMSRARVDRPKEDSFRISSGNRDTGLLSA
jgi:hypothetical protein